MKQIVLDVICSYLPPNHTSAAGIVVAKDIRSFHTEHLESGLHWGLLKFLVTFMRRFHSAQQNWDIYAK